MKRILLAAAILLGLPLPAAAHGGAVMIPMIVPVPPPTVPAAQSGDYQRLHNVAVVSAIGVALTVQKNTFMGPSQKRLDIRDWTLDDKVAALIKQYLGGRFSFRDVAYDPVAIAALPNGPMNNSTTALLKILSGLPRDGLDAFIVVRPDLEMQAPGVEGLGLEFGNAFGGATIPVVWANYEIDIVDAQTLTLIAKASSRVQLRAGGKLGFAGIDGPQALLPGDDESLTPDQQTLLRAFANSLVTKSLIETLRSLQLGVALPEPGARTLVPIPADKNPYPAIKTIAVASAIGTQLELKHRGMFFARGDYTLPVPDWRLDAEIESAMRAALARTITVKDAPIDRQALTGARILNDDGKPDPAFPGLVQSQDVDAYLISVPIKRACYITDCTGLGMLNDTPATGAFTDVYANFALVLVDAHTLKVLAAATAILPPDEPNLAAVKAVDNGVWPAAPPALSAGQAAALHSALSELIAKSVPETMMFMGLTGMMVASQPPPAPQVAIAPAAQPASAPPPSNSPAQ